VPLLDVNVMSLAEVTANGGEVYTIGNRLEVWLHHECAIECFGQDGLYSIDAVIPTASQSLYVVASSSQGLAQFVAQKTWPRRYTNSPWHEMVLYLE
jgi:hypothetical protein